MTQLPFKNQNSVNEINMYVKKLLELPTIKRLLTSKNKQTNKKNQKKTKTVGPREKAFTKKERLNLAISLFPVG